MKISRSVFVRVLVVMTLLAVLVPVSASATPADQCAAHRVIVIFDNADQSAVTKGHLAALGATQITGLPLVRGAVLTVPSGVSLAALRAIPGVVHVEEDLLVTALKKPVPEPEPEPAEVIPWGIERVGASVAWALTTGSEIKVAVLDTGIDTAHPDLAANVAGGYNAINPRKSYADDNGHGTHVAGIIAAVDDEAGVVGVAPGAELYGVKVLNRSGSGYTSDIIEGIQWAVNNDMDVINMSLGSPYYSEAFDDACQAAVAAGVTIVAAAGNEGSGEETVLYPAKYDNVIGVSATDQDNYIAWFSSRGTGVDLAAPGVSIYSTYKSKTYATLDGTSMASPHVAGVVALVLTTSVGSDDLDSDGLWDPDEVEARLQRTADDLGDPGFDTNYGAGLVRADLAVLAN